MLDSPRGLLKNLMPRPHPSPVIKENYFMKETDYTRAGQGNIWIAVLWTETEEADAKWRVRSRGRRKGQGVIRNKVSWAWLMHGQSNQILGQVYQTLTTHQGAHDYFGAVRNHRMLWARDWHGTMWFKVIIWNENPEQIKPPQFLETDRLGATAMT